MGVEDAVDLNYFKKGDYVYSRVQVTLKTDVVKEQD